MLHCAVDRHGKLCGTVLSCSKGGVDPLLLAEMVAMAQEVILRWPHAAPSPPDLIDLRLPNPVQAGRAVVENLNGALQMEAKLTTSGRRPESGFLR
jgi:hypothetical protein